MDANDLTPDEIRQHAQMHAALYKKTPAKRRGQTPEARATAQVNKYLDSLGCLNIRTGAGSVEIDGRRISIGLAGTSDRTVCLPAAEPGGIAAFCAVEIKATTELTDRQRRYLDKVRALGGVAIVARSVADVRSALVERFGESTVAAWEASGKTRRAR